MFFKTEVEVRKGKKMLKVSPNMQNTIIWILALIIFCAAASYFTIEVFRINKLFAVLAGLIGGAAYGILYKQELHKIQSRKKPDTDIVMENPDRRDSAFWMEIY